MSSDFLLRLLVPAFLLASCSVKEDRTDCPCLLSLDLTGIPVLPVMLEVTGEDGYAYTQVVHGDTVIVLPVPKGRVTVSAVGGALSEGDGSIRIPSGEEAPPLYLFHRVVSTEAEQYSLPVHLRKQFCSLELTFSGPPGFGPPFEVEVDGRVNGWESDGSPSEGEFSRRLLPGSDGNAVLRLPRQADDSLVMHIVFLDQVVRTFALGSYIESAGYDWEAQDLEDLTLQVDISVTGVALTSDFWGRSEEMEIWI